MNETAPVSTGRGPVARFDLTRRAQAMRSKLPRLTWRALLVVLAYSAAVLLVSAVVASGAFRDWGYPDSATLLRVREVAETGRIFPPFDRPPYLVSIYGPLTYASLAVPYALAERLGADPRVAVQATIACALFASLALVFVLSRQLYASNRTAAISLLFAASITFLPDWVVQIRGDFIGLFFSLLCASMALQWMRSSAAGWYFGAIACAAAAVLTKQTFIAVPLGVFVSLIFGRRWVRALAWATGVGLVAAGSYLLVWQREPAMLQHYAALGHPLFEFRVGLKLITSLRTQLLLPFAVAGIVMATRTGSPTARVLALIAGASWGIAVLTVFQAGAAVNYFWEGLLICSVFAGGGAEAIRGRLQGLSGPAWALLLLVMIPWEVSTLATSSRSLARDYREQHGRSGRLAEWTALSNALSGKRVLSPMPDVSLLGTPPVVPDPILASYLEVAGTWNYSPIIADLQAGRFDAVIIRPGRIVSHGSYRGVPLWNDTVWKLVSERYKFDCRYSGLEIWVPRETPPHVCGDIARAAKMSRLGSG